MVNAAPPSQSSYVVARPRASDAVGAALRTAYCDRSLPDDMLRLLRTLDAVGAGRHN